MANTSRSIIRLKKHNEGQLVVNCTGMSQNPKCFHKNHFHSVKTDENITLQEIIDRININKLSNDYTSNSSPLKNLSETSST